MDPQHPGRQRVLHLARQKRNQVQHNTVEPTLNACDDLREIQIREESPGAFGLLDQMRTLASKNTGN